MKILFRLRLFLIVIAAVAFESSCEKVKNPVPMGDAGQTLVKLLGGGTAAEPGSKTVNIELLSTPQVIDAVDLRRDIPNNAELNRTMNVVIKNDPGAASAVDPNLVGLPDGSYTLSNNVEVIGDEYRVNLAPGVFAQTIKLTLTNASTLDPTKSYAAGFTINAVDADGKILNEEKSFVVVLSTKNKWDGTYRLYGGFSRSDQPGFIGVSQSPVGFYEPYDLITRGPNTVDATVFTAAYGVTNTQFIWNAGTSVFTYFTGVAPRLNISNSNDVTVVPGVAAVGTSVAFTQNAGELAASKYYPTGIAGHPFAAGRKTIVAHFRWTSGAIDRITKDTFVYLRPR
jgi:hypothetical protein